MSIPLVFWSNQTTTLPAPVLASQLAHSILHVSLENDMIYRYLYWLALPKKRVVRVMWMHTFFWPYQLSPSAQSTLYVCKQPKVFSFLLCCCLMEKLARTSAMHMGAYFCALPTSSNCLQCIWAHTPRSMSNCQTIIYPTGSNLT